MTDNPSATYRGYRKQALYVLSRILTDAHGNSRSYCPEGEEDLAVFDNAGRLMEAIQVKDYSSPLSLSDFKPGSSDGYFARMKRRRTEHPYCQHLLATFGPVGEELQGAIDDAGKHQDEVARKLSERNSSISHAEARELLNALNGKILFLDESKLKEEIATAVKDTIAGVEHAVALELLLYWIYDASERLRIITKSTLLLQLQRIGCYLSALRDHTSEWMVALWPLESKSLSDEEKERLLIEYGCGVQARWKHILADADCFRHSRLTELHELVSNHSAVVVRGASGQGKSTLALRYIHEYCAEGLRFQVRYVEGRAHAARIANALRGHVEQLRLSAVVLLDLAPSDSGWAELVRDLVDIGLKVIVTVREEDYRRAGTFSPDIDASELLLDSISREEAASIYHMLVAGGHSAKWLDFDDAWARFSSSDAAPLLEFTHLVSEGQSLTAKVAAQIGRLQQEAGVGTTVSGLTTNHLRLLALAVVANAAECKVIFKNLCMAVGLDPLTSPLQVLENEYLLRQVQHGGHVTISGLHSLRSQAIENALLRECPDIWGDLAVQCIPLVVDEDIERFLLHAFSRHPEHSAVVEAALHDLSLRSWTHAGGIGRALLWEGVNRYERENHETLDTTVATHSSAWWMFCDSFVGMDSSRAENLWESCEQIFKKELPKVYLTDKNHIFTPLTNWAYHIRPPSSVPKTATDWALAGDLAFWLGTKKVETEITSSLLQLLPEPLPKDMSVSELASFISGRYALGDQAFVTWHDRYASELVQRYLRETKSIHVADDGEEVKVYFSVILADASSEKGDGGSLNTQAMQRLNLLREVFPQKARFGSQGVGIEVLEAFCPHNETMKSIPADNIPPARAIELNVTFMNLVDYRLRRADSWRDYAVAAFDFRRSACDCFRQLQRAWGRLLEEKIPQQKTQRLIPVAGLEKVQKQSQLPLFPRSAVDEWGFISEAKEKGSTQGNQGLWHNLKRFRQWKKMWQEYETGVGQVANLAFTESLNHLLLKKNLDIGQAGEPRSGGVLLNNLGSAWEALSLMQVEFRQWFSRYVSAQHLQELEAHEKSVFKHLWAVTFNFVNSPFQLVAGGAATLERTIEQKRREFLRQLREQLASVMADKGVARVLEGPFMIDGKRNLVIVCDHKFVETIDPFRPMVVLAIWRAAQAPGWRNQEWQPLIIEWPQIFVTHIVQGRALFAGGVSLASLVLFGILEDFEVKPHHLMQFPVSNSDYALLGISTHEGPLLSAVVKLQEAFFAFILTLPRFFGLAKVSAEHGLSDVELQQTLESFSKEVSAIRRNAQQGTEDLFGLLHILPDANELEWAEVITRLENLCSRYFFLEVEEQTTTITFDKFAEWVMHIQEDINEVSTLFTAILKRAVEG